MRGLGSPWEAEGSRRSPCVSQEDAGERTVRKPRRALTRTYPAGALVAASSLQVRGDMPVVPATRRWDFVTQPEPLMAAWRAPSRGAEPPRASGIKYAGAGNPHRSGARV